MMYLIGLTGSICTGKSHVLAILDELGCFVFRADELAKKLIFSPDPEIAERIIAACREEVRNSKGELDKSRFTELLFQDLKIREVVNNIVHPLVIKERNKKINDIEKTGIYDFFVYESALLVEAGTYKDFDKIIVVYSSPGEQVKRLMARDEIDRHSAEAKIQSQFPLKEKLKVADYTIDTSGSFENTRLATLEVFHLLKNDFEIIE